VSQRSRELHDVKIIRRERAERYEPDASELQKADRALTKHYPTALP
jgi:hypothetical protein